MTNLTGKIVLITGATRGIGKAIATELGRQGATILATATTETGANQISRELQQQTIAGKGYVMNVADETSIDTAYRQMEKDFGPPDILINNAGITQDNLLLRMKSEEWHKVIETNLNSVFYLSKLCLKSMLKKRWGRIINISSVVAGSGNPGQANYCASKAGIIGFTKSLAQEVASRNITCNVVAPGFVETSMTEKLTSEQQEFIFDRIPMKRMGQPIEIAYAVAFLASSMADYITGETLHVNGGMLMV